MSPNHILLKSKLYLFEGMGIKYHILPFSTKLNRWYGRDSAPSVCQESLICMRSMKSKQLERPMFTVQQSILLHQDTNK